MQLGQDDAGRSSGLVERCCEAAGVVASDCDDQVVAVAIRASKPRAAMMSASFNRSVDDAGPSTISMPVADAKPAEAPA